MPQWRKLHTKITESLDVNDMPDDFTRLVWVLLPLGLDREGRCHDNPALVRAKLMPLRTDIADSDIARALDWFAEHGMIVRYIAHRHGYFYAPTFRKYQGPCEKEAPSSLPGPEEADAPVQADDTPDDIPDDAIDTPKSSELVQSYSRVFPDLVKTDSLLERERELRESKEREKESAPPPEDNSLVPALARYFEHNAGRFVDQHALDDINELVKLPIQAEWLPEAAQIADDRGKKQAGNPRWGYIMGILRNMADDGRRAKAPPRSNGHGGVRQTVAPGFEVIT